MNTRLAESHCDLFEKVDGRSNHEIAIDIAMGRKPDFPASPGRVQGCREVLSPQVPGRRRHRGARIRPTSGSSRPSFPAPRSSRQVRKGTRLSELPEQDSYSFAVAHIFMACREPETALEYIPYRKRDKTVHRDGISHPYVAGHGYACVRVDLRGSGDSDGVLTTSTCRRSSTTARGAALDRVPAVVRRQRRDDRHLLGRVQRAAARRPATARARRHRHGVLDRRPLRRRRALHGRLPARRQPVLGVGRCSPATPRAPGPGAGRATLARAVARATRGFRAVARDLAAHQHRDDYWRHGSVCEDYLAHRVPGHGGERLGRRLLERGVPAAGRACSPPSRG
jgi:hypothetical protein